MSKEQYYAILKEKWAEVDPNNLDDIKRYNKFKKMLRSLMEWEND